MVCDDIFSVKSIIETIGEQHERQINGV